MKHIIVKGPEWSVTLGNNLPLVFMAGPCVIEGREFALETASRLRDIFEKAGLRFIYKSSFDKANRTSMDSYRGVGITEGIDILHQVREAVGVPIITDVHSPEQALLVAAVADMLQTPAFLSRQSDLIRAAAETGRPVNIKKGQFLAPWDMKNVIEKAVATGNDQIALCERGTTFGYGNLVVDMRSLQVMAQFGYPVVFDATHSVQLPGGQGTCSGGQREFVPSLARAAVAVGVAAVFIETHPAPEKALCDGPNMISFADLPEILRQLKEIDLLVKGSIS
ncbi:MAG: 3-deoxy-8-phosphooctulonate synthase [Syntrophobacteraceae bacterium]